MKTKGRKKKEQIVFNSYCTESWNLSALNGIWEREHNRTEIKFLICHKTCTKYDYVVISIAHKKSFLWVGNTWLLAQEA